MEELDESDMLLITTSQFTSIPAELLTQMIGFARELQRDVVVHRRFGHRGAPWDFNLRDLFRWCELMVIEQCPPHWQPYDFVDRLFLQRMRTPEDRQRVLELYARWFSDDASTGVGSETAQSLQPHYSITPEYIQVGHVWLARSALPQAEPEGSGRAPQILHTQLRPLAALMTCIRMQWMCILTGEAGTGKTALARLLARLAGRSMLEVTLSTATDTTEILGCFEQSEPSRLRLNALVTTGELVAQATQALLLASSSSECINLVTALQGSWARVGTAQDDVGNAVLSEDTSWPSERLAAFDEVLLYVEHAATTLNEPSFHEALATMVDCNGVADKLSTMSPRIASVKRQLDEAKALVASGVRGRFVWVDGPLVTAMEQGSWLLLDNANLCNPSVLDRLNPLLERGGVFQMPECGLQKDGSVRELMPHPDFRLIFTMDPSRGELSRAMRNRGVEVSLMPIPSRSRDMLALLSELEAEAPPKAVDPALNGGADVIPVCRNWATANAMLAVHERVSQMELATGSCTTAALLQWAQLALSRRQRGSDAPDALAESAAVIYTSRIPAKALEDLKDAALRCGDADLWSAARLALSLEGVTSPSLWPAAVGSHLYTQNATLASVCCQGTLMVQLALCSSAQPSDAVISDTSSPPAQEAMHAQLMATVWDFVSRSSIVDLPMRRSLVRELRDAAASGALVSSGGILRALVCAEAMLTAIETHPLMLALMNALQSACSSDSNLWSACVASPRDLERLNPPLFERVRRAASPGAPPSRSCSTESPAVDGSNEGTAAAWRTYTRLLPRTRLLLRILFETEGKHEDLRSVAASKDLDDMSLLEKSYALHGSASLQEQRDHLPEDDGPADGTIAVGEVWARVAEVLHPCLDTVTSALVTWLQSSPMADQSSDTTYVHALNGVFGAVRMLWQCSSSANGCGRDRSDVDYGLDLQTFLVGWRAFHKRLAKLAQPPTSVTLPDDLMRACDRVSRAARFDESRFSAVLWKHGGHPSAARSSSQLDAGIALRQLAQTLQLPVDCVGATFIKEQPSHLALWAGPELRHDLLLGACTIESIGELQVENMGRANGQRDADSSPLEAQLLSIPRTLQLRLNAIKSHQQRHSEAVEDTSADAPPPALLQLTLQTRAAVPLWPLFDLRSAGEEATLLVPLLELLWSRVHVQNQVQDPNPSTVAAMRSQAERLVRLITSNCGRSPLDAAAVQTLAWRLSEARHDEISWLSGSVCSLSASWHHHLWTGAFETPEGPFARGPVALLLCSEAPTISSQLRRAQGTPLGERDSVLALLLRLRDALHDPAARREPLTAAHDWLLLLHVLCLTLHPFAARLPREDTPLFVQALTVMHDSSTHYLALAGAHSSRHSVVPPDSMSAAMDAVRRILPKCQDAAMVSALEPLLGPCLDEIASAVHCIASAAREGKPEMPACHDERGRAWVLLGLLRWQLLLPSHPVDPTCKYSVKHATTAALVQEWQHELVGLQLSQEVWNGAASSTELRERNSELETARQAKRLAAERMCARPEPPAAQFSQLHLEATQWDRSLGAQGSILELSSALRRGGEAALAREAGWQESSGRFAARLAESYGGFEDVAAPLRLALYQVKHGLHTQAAAGSPTALVTSDKQSADSARSVIAVQSLMHALLSFPQQPQSHLASLTTTSAVQERDNRLPSILMPLLQPFPSKSVDAASQPPSWRVAQQTGLLVLALRRLYVMVLLSGRANPSHLRALNKIMSAFAETQVEVEAAEAKRQEEEAQLYKHKARTYGSTIDEQAQEHDALRALFPDFADDFADLVERAKEAPTSGAFPMGGENDMDGIDDEEEEADDDDKQDDEKDTAESTAQPLQVDPALILQLVHYHHRVFNGSARYTAANAITALSAETQAAATKAAAAVAGRPSKPKAAKITGKHALKCDPKGEGTNQPNDEWRLAEAQTQAVMALRQAHGLASELLPRVASMLPAAMDTQARGAQLTLTCWTWQRLQGRATDSLDAEATSVALFSEENHEEVGRLIPIVDSIATRVAELLLQWPEHSTLQLVRELCERLKGFRVGSPLMRFVTGAELLLKQAWTWEQVAARHTSMKGQIDELTSLVLRWRKMELHAWPRLLECAASQAHEAALARVWVRLFRVVHSSSADGGDADGQAPLSAEELATHHREFFAVVEQMMRSSSVGAYEAHLQLLQTFEAQLRIEDRLAVQTEGVRRVGESTRRQGYANILHNIAAYHRQFVAPLKVSVAAQIEPLETKLRDFIKLAQWTDRNFDGLKESIERSHSQLNRCVQQYKGVLEQPAATLLASSQTKPIGEDGEDGDKSSKGRAKMLPPSKLTEMLLQAATGHVSTKGSATPAETSVPVSALLAKLRPSSKTTPAQSQLRCERLPVLRMRIEGFCRQSILSADASERCDARDGCLDDLRESIVLRATELRKLTDKKARQQKHKAVVDLLKGLHESGLSFHVSAIDRRQSSMGDLFVSVTEPTFEVRAALTGALRLPTESSTSTLSQITSDTGVHATEEVGAEWEREWSRCAELYYRCVFRLTQLRHASQAPHHDLTPREVQKASGMMEHGFTIILHQREAISAALTQCALLQAQLNELTQLDASHLEARKEPTVSPPSSILGVQANVREMLMRLNELTGQALHLSVETNALYELHGSLPHRSGSQVLLLAAALKRCSVLLQNIRATLPDGIHASLLTSQHACDAKRACEQVEQMRAELASLVDTLSEGEASHVAPLLAKLGEISELSGAEAYGRSAASADAQVIGSFVDSLEAATNEILLAVQGLRQISMNPPVPVSTGGTDAEPVKSDEADGSDADSSIRLQHEWLQKLLHAGRAELIVSRVSAVVSRIRDLADRDGDGPDSERGLATRAAVELSEALRMYMCALRWAIHQSLTYHGALVRLECVLLALFQELFSKGFCTANPEDEGGDGAGGQGKLEDDVEGTGMGEGKGKQDVSQELEEEGQIEGDSATKKEEGDAQDDDLEGGKEERAKEEEGVEMTNEFEGDMKNMEQPPGGDEGSDDGKDEEDEPEHGMGDLDDENQEVVDERLWDKEEDDHLKPEGDEKKEQDAEVEGSGEVQMEAKEDEDEDDGKKKNQPKEQKETQPQRAPDEGAEGEDGGEGEEQGSDEEEKEDDEGDVRPETEYEENHYKNAGKEEKEEEGKEEEAMPDEIPEAMDAEEGGAGGEDENMQDGEDVEEEPADVGEGPPPPAEEKGGEDEEDDNEGDETMKTALDAEEEDEQEPDEEETPGGTDGAAPEAEEESGEEEERDGEEDASNDQSNRQQYDAAMSFEEGRGVSADAPAMEMQQDAQAEQNEQSTRRPEDAADAADGAKRSSATASGDHGEGSEYMPSSAPPPAGAPPPPPPPRRQPQPNPYRSLGDALKFWHRKFELVQREMAAEEEAEPAAQAEQELDEPPKEQQGGAEEMDVDEAREFELTAKHEASDAQVMADATQEQYEAMMQAKQQAEATADDEGGDDTAGMAAGEEDADDNADGAVSREEEDETMPGPPEGERPPSPQREAPKRSGAEELTQGPAKRRKGGGEQDDRTDDPASVEDVDNEETEDMAREVLDGKRSQREEDAADGGGSHVGGDAARKPERDETKSGHGATSVEADEEEEALEEAEAAMADMEEDLETRLAEWQLDGGASGDVRAAEDAWRALESRTSSLAQELTEQLRLILEATIASKLQGDYRTGKRISMRKVIPYIASGFRKDKIWLRRTKPSKRQYQILLCIDDSESMRATGAGMLACEALALICQALTTVEAGQLGVVSFAEQVSLLHPFGRPFTAESGAHMLSSFTFRQQHTHMETLLKSIVTTLRLAREQQSAGASAEQLQLVLIVSDGRRSPTWGDPKQWIRKAAQENILLCFVVLDAAAEKDSILELKSVTYPNGKLTISRYIDEFPFPYYLVVRELKALPQVLSDALRQWFEMLKE